jgi:serine protease Do
MIITKRKIWTFAIVTLLAGVILGLVISSNFDWTKSGYARMGIAREKDAVKIGSDEPVLNDNFDLLQTSKAFVEVAKRVMPTVVSVTSAKVVRVRNPFTEFFHEDWWGRSFRDRRGREREFRQEGLGSGVIISSDGYVLTNNHVIREAEEIVVIIDKKEYSAKVIGADPKTDLAVIKINAKNMPVAKLGNSDDLDVGEWVLAIGSPFSVNLQHSITAGIVSGKGRTRVGVSDIDYEDFIQTDAAINPGNSGGALVNLRGELVGINTAIISSGWGGGNLGIGFAIPINLAKQIMQQLIESGKVVRGWLGVHVQPVDEEIAKAMNLPSTAGALVSDLVPNTPAAKAGIRNGDFIVAFDGKPIQDDNNLVHLVAGYKPGSRVPVKVIRDGEEKTITVTLGERPEQEPEQLSLAEGDENQPSSRRLGIQVSEVDDELAREYNIEAPNGIVVTDVQSGSQAEKEGIRPGDLILEIKQEPVRHLRDFRRILSTVKKGDIVLLRINRGETNFFVALKVEDD